MTRRALRYEAFAEIHKETYDFLSMARDIEIDLSDQEINKTKL